VKFLASFGLGAQECKMHLSLRGLRFEVYLILEECWRTTLDDGC
jgi:hypothetical protein